MGATRIMLGRRPKQTGQAAFGYLNLNAAAQVEVEQIVTSISADAHSRTAVKFNLDDLVGPHEVMTHPLKQIDHEFEPQVPWSLERMAAAITVTGKPTVMTASEIINGDWSFYALHASVGGTAATVIRSTSPTRALKHSGRFITQFTGGELKPVPHPLVAVDHQAEALIEAGTVYIFRPQQLEKLLIDGETIKQRAAKITAAFSHNVGANLSPGTQSWLGAVCSKNSIVGRRVERLSRGNTLGGVSVAKLREGLKDADLPNDAFGTDKQTIDLASGDHAVALIDIAADLYYQPRFEAAGRKVAAYRKLS